MILCCRCNQVSHSSVKTVKRIIHEVCQGMEDHSRQRHPRKTKSGIKDKKMLRQTYNKNVKRWHHARQDELSVDSFTIFVYQGLLSTDARRAVLKWEFGLSSTTSSINLVPEFLAGRPTTALGLPWCMGSTVSETLWLLHEGKPRPVFDRKTLELTDNNVELRSLGISQRMTMTDWKNLYLRHSS